MDMIERDPLFRFITNTAAMTASRFPYHAHVFSRIWPYPVLDREPVHKWHYVILTPYTGVIVLSCDEEYELSGYFMQDLPNSFLEKSEWGLRDGIMTRNPVLMNRELRDMMCRDHSIPRNQIHAVVIFGTDASGDRDQVLAENEYLVSPSRFEDRLAGLLKFDINASRNTDLNAIAKLDKNLQRSAAIYGIEKMRDDLWG